MKREIQNSSVLSSVFSVTGLASVLPFKFRINASLKCMGIKPCIALISRVQSKRAENSRPGLRSPLSIVGIYRIFYILITRRRVYSLQISGTGCSIFQFRSAEQTHLHFAFLCKCKFLLVSLKQSLRMS